MYVCGEDEGRGGLKRILLRFVMLLSSCRHCFIEVTGCTCIVCLWFHPPAHHALWSSLQESVFLPVCSYLWPQLEEVQPARGDSYVPLCSWLPASGFILLEECGIAYWDLCGASGWEDTQLRRSGTGVRRQSVQRHFCCWPHLNGDSGLSPGEEGMKGKRKEGKMARWQEGRQCY